MGAYSIALSSGATCGPLAERSLPERKPAGRGGCLIWLSEYGPVSRSVNVLWPLPTQPASPTLDAEQALKPLSGGLMTRPGVGQADGYFVKR